MRKLVAGKVFLLRLKTSCHHKSKMKDFNGLRRQIQDHELYREIRSVEDLRIFMEAHVFAVWDFMSLLKSLQQSLTSVTVPWVPSRFATSRRLINEIVLIEESDEYEGGYSSHFELYLAAMEECGADTRHVRRLVSAVQNGVKVQDALWDPGIPTEAREFVWTTFETIRPDQPHVTAASFTIGREDLIPTMFYEMVQRLRTGFDGLRIFEYYLQRHIEVDSDSHGPMALWMLEELCAKDETRLAQADAAAEKALQARLRLWDGILDRILRTREAADSTQLVGAA